MKFKNFLINKKRWIYFLAAFVIICLGVAAVYYYLNIYLKKPNFDDTQSNFVSSATAEKVKPAEHIKYIVNYKNNGNVNVDNFDIEIEIPDNTFFVTSNHNEILKTGSNSRIIDFEIGTVFKRDGDSVSFEVEVNKPLDNETKIELNNLKFN